VYEYYYFLCGDNSLAGFNVEEGNEVGLKEGFGVGSFDLFVNEEGTVVGFNEEMEMSLAYLVI